ncbi:MAG: hypothetical protein K5886_04295 [Lachnospiraceae bacterium]|nr:hypothetical protein [Lachnospiraceae bacterium]
MPTVSETIEKAIELLGPQMVLKKNVFINAIEDINPHISDEIGVLKKAYTDEIGVILYQMIGDGSADKTVYLKRLTDHLVNECEYNERFTKRFTACFSGFFADVPGSGKMSGPDTSHKADSKNTGKEEILDRLAEIDSQIDKKKTRKEEILDELAEIDAQLAEKVNRVLRKRTNTGMAEQSGQRTQETKKAQLSTPKPDDRKQRLIQRYEKAVTLFDEGKEDEAVMLLQSINDGGEYEAKAQHMLGDIFEADKEEAFRHYLGAAKLGDIEAQFIVGYMSEYGEGTKKDVSKAAEWYKKAADAGHRGAQHNLGVFYYSGILGKPDYGSAFRYFYLAADQGKPSSMRNIGVMYELGKYVEKNKEYALYWYKKASECGDPDAKADYDRLSAQLA